MLGKMGPCQGLQTCFDGLRDPDGIGPFPLGDGNVDGRVHHGAVVRLLGRRRTESDPCVLVDFRWAVPDVRDIFQVHRPIVRYRNNRPFKLPCIGEKRAGLDGHPLVEPLESPGARIDIAGPEPVRNLRG